MKRKAAAQILALLLAFALCIPASAFNEPGTVGKPVVLSAGGETAAFIDRQDNLWIWGRTQYGMMGVGKTQDHGDDENTFWQKEPLKIMEHVRSVSISAGWHSPYAAAIQTDGTLWMWGRNYCGQIGNGEYKTEQKTPVKVMDDVASVSCYGNRTAAVKTNGELWMWGDARNNAFNQGLYEGNTPGETYQTVPYKIMDQVDSVYFRDTENNPFFKKNPYILKTDGTLITWPINAGMTKVDPHSVDENGNWILPEPIRPTSPLPIETVAEDVAFVNSISNSLVNQGIETLAIIKKDGSLWMSGGNQDGLLGSRDVFKKEYIPLTEFVKVMDHVSAFTCGYTAALAIESKVTETNEIVTSIKGWGQLNSPLLRWDMMVDLIGGPQKTWTDAFWQKRSDRYVMTPLNLILAPTFYPPKLPTGEGPSI